MTERVDTVVIGGGQTGLTAGYELQRRGRPFVILDAHERIGDAWRRRWDSLILFTPGRFNGLPGMRFPGRAGSYTTKDQMADYLEAYAERFALPVRTGTRVIELARDGELFSITTNTGRIEARNVIVAMSNHQQPKVPPFAGDLDGSIVQLHSHAYRHPGQLQDGPVLVVGLGNSGADIGIEVARTRETWVAGKEWAHVPFRIDTLLARHLLIRMVRFMGHHVLSVRTPIGRKARPTMMSKGAPLVRVKPKDLVAAGVHRVGRITGVRDGKPVTQEGDVLDVRNVIWCTGYRTGFSWIDLPILGDHQHPVHERGIVEQEPGLYFVGLFFLYAATSETVTGMPRDVRRVVRHLVRHREQLPDPAPVS